MKKLSLVLTLLFATVFTSFSQTAITESQARRIASAFTASRAFNSQEVQLVSANQIYVYNIGTQGFVIVSGNTVLPPVIGWSDQGTFPDLTNAPDNVASWINHYGEMIDFAVANGIAPEADIKRQWEEAERGVFGAKNATEVSPLLSTRWNQDCYYNEYCPSTGWWGGGPCGHVYAGCVACAMAQVMKYWEFPEQGHGSHSYNHSQYGVQSADFGATTYRWDEMPNEVWEHNDAVATLMYHCGVSVNMNYAADGSGAQSRDVETALRSYFGYCGAKYHEKTAYSDEAWISMLKAELDLAHPMYYSGANGSSGHAFVCDGYDSSDNMHFNFGWSGSGDAYYSIYDVNGFNQGQAVVTNIIPMELQADANGIFYVTPDGTGDGSSWENATNKLEFVSNLSNNGSAMVWVKKGTYYGDITNPEGAFGITGNNRIYGGFNGDEAPDFDLSQRDFVNNASILDGQNARRVLLQEKNLTAGTIAIWDGFTIQNGMAGSGAGAYLNNFVTLSNCIIRNNTASMFGGGLYLNSGGNEARTTLKQCIVKDNSASMGGGVCDRVGGTFTNCSISNNTASTKGGGVYLYINTKPTFTNSVIANNTAKSAGGIFNRGTLTAQNCNIVMNYGIDSIGGVFNEKHYNKYTNCIFWGNKAKEQPNQVEGPSNFEYCAVQGGWEGTGIINLPAANSGEEPGGFVRFSHHSQAAGADYYNDDWSLQPRSICLNAGKPNTSGIGTTDIAGNPRIQKSRIDIGAYENCASLTMIEDELHESDAPYWFYSRPLTEPGYYTIALEGHDCDSIIGLTLDVLSGVSETENSNVSVWPNPTNGILHIEAECIEAIEVRNLLGQVILRAKETNAIDLNGLKNGVYFLIASNKNGARTITKVVKE